MNKLLFLDFDGVLFDTVNEAYEIARKLSSKDDINIDLFKKYRYLVGPAWNYKYLMDAITNSEQVNIEAYYSHEIHSAKKTDYQQFENEFFEYRNLLKNHSFTKWNSYNTPYPFLYKFVKLNLNALNLYIISTKDEKTIIEIFESHHINIVLPDNIFGKSANEKYGGKQGIINFLMLQNEPSKALFIDDMYSHLNECKLITNLSLMQADWGYCNPNENHEYRKTEIEAINEITDFMKL